MQYFLNLFKVEYFFYINNTIQSQKRFFLTLSNSLNLLLELNKNIKWKVQFPDLFPANQSDNVNLQSSIIFFTLKMQYNHENFFSLTSSNSINLLSQLNKIIKWKVSSRTFSQQINQTVWICLQRLYGMIWF